ncbi:MAG: hypothetical protein V4601_14530 [Pseudomonadota bacterium]
MKLAIIGAAVVSLAFALPASAQRSPDTPAVGTKSSSGATGFVPPNGMVNGSTSAASYPDRAPSQLGAPRYYYDREARLMTDPRYAPYEELRYEND